MKIIGITTKQSIDCKKYEKLFRNMYKYFVNKGKEIYIDEKIAKIIKKQSYKKFNRGKTDVDLLIVFGGDGTILSVVRQMSKFNAKIFGINIGNLGFMSEIPPIKIKSKLDKILKGEYTLDKRMMIHVEVIRNKKVIRKFHALNEAAIVHGKIARLINLKTKVNDRKLTIYHADGLIIATPTGSTAYNLSAGGPIVYPGLNTLILTPIAPHSLTQKPIIIPADKSISITIDSEAREPNLTIDGQESMLLKNNDEIRIKRDGEVNFVRLPSESFFRTLRQKLHWGKN